MKNDIIVKNTQEVIESIVFNRNRRASFVKKNDIIDKNNIIGLCWSMPGEVDVIKLAVNFPTKAVLPKLKGTKMYYVKYSYNSKMKKSLFSKLIQPRNEDKVEPRIPVISGISLSLNGDRLGFGTGHYDRYVSEKSTRQNIVKIGVCFHKYSLKYLPREPHDLRMDYIITEK